MWLLNKISCEIQILNEKVWKLMIENGKLEKENKKLKEKLDNRDLLLKWKRKEVQTLFKVNEELTAENKKLKERIDELEKCNLNLQERLDRKEELNKKMREEIKDHQLYEEKLEHRIIEFEELLHWE